MPFSRAVLWILALASLPLMGFAKDQAVSPLNLHATDASWGLIALTIFAIAYALVILEEFTELRKSKPVVLAAGVIWLFVAVLSNQQDVSHLANQAIENYIYEFAELFLFLLVAMTYINAITERGVFEALRGYLLRLGLNFRQLYWITGILAFIISPIADNLTTSLIMCSVLIAVADSNKKFIVLGCINIVIAANAGGAFSPFGDITTLMVWQNGLLPFQDFFSIFLPSLVNFLIPALIMYFAVPKVQPQLSQQEVHLKIGAKRLIALFLLTILTAISVHQFLHLPPTMGMMMGLGYLQIFSYYLRYKEKRYYAKHGKHHGEGDHPPRFFDIFRKIQRIEWDTLLFFYGVIICVGGLATIGYLELAASFLYGHLGHALPEVYQATPANVLVGFFSAILDNIPVMFAVLTMDPSMTEGQWLLVTLTAGIGGSLLSVGSAAGVALMGQARGFYTFFEHLKWTWVILLGYIAAIACHLWLNADLFHVALK